MNVISPRTLSSTGGRTRTAVFSLVAVCCCLLIAAWSSQAATPTAKPVKRQVIVLPFDVEIPGSYTYLRNGLASTLASRLASRASIAVVAQGGTSEQMAKALKSGDYSAFSQQLRQTGAEYLIMGLLMPKNGQFELSSYVFSQALGQTPKKFAQNFDAIDEAMTAVDELAWDISVAVFGVAKPETTSTGKKHAGGMAAFQTVNPERAYLDGLLAGKSSTGLESGGPFELISSFRSKNIAVEPMDINAGDIDGDGKEEIVLLTRSSLMIYRFDDGQFRMLATVDLPNYLRYQSVTLGDLNKNGRQEIYISGSNQDNPDSSALEWDGKKVSFLFQHVGWYLRAMTNPGEAPVLIGQGQLAGEPGGRDLYSMVLDAKTGVSSDKKLALPKGINIFDFNQADIDGDGAKETIAINRNNHLEVYDAAGNRRWSSAEIYGASNNFFGTLTSQGSTVDDNKTTWVHTRIIIADLDRDGINDVLVGSNRLATVPYMPNLRYFEGSSLSGLKWEKGGLIPLWQTKKIPYYVTNYQIAGAGKGSDEYRIFFAEAETSYPFVFWNSPSAFLNSYTLRVNRPAR